MSLNPHFYLLTRNLKSRTSFYTAALALTTRGGGGGHFHRPDPKLPTEYVHTRRIHLQDINTILYHDFAPEYHMHLHSPFVQNGRQGVALIFIYFFLIICPAWFIATRLQKMAGAMLFPSLRPGKDHAHMAPRLINHLKENNYENKQDALGRRTAAFYKNFNRQVMDPELKPTLIKKIEKHGFKF